MTIKQIAETLGLQIMQPDFTDTDITWAYTGDLLSDVMGNAHPAREVAAGGGIFITIQAHKNTIAVATLANFNAIIICNNRECPEDMLEAAKEEDIAVLHTRENQFTIGGKLYTVMMEHKK
ncbi:MAG: hypothetical protein LBM77_00220 [Spirochaetaceae bacterium]|jgi:hypothetical protein|nr:hypothetical protein [Spirochaetaceae bacterium]